MRPLLYTLSALFILERLFLQDFLIKIGGQAGPYIFEGLLILSFLALAREELHFRFRFTWQWAFLGSLNIIFGASIFFLCENMGLVVPFDFSSKSFAFMLIVVGPLMEELLFRGLLWQSLRPIFHSAFWTLLITSVLFSFDHFGAFFRVPADFQSFILFQTFYTLLFGLLWGYSRLKTNSVLAAVILHALFNLGFYSAAKVYPRSAGAEQSMLEAGDLSHADAPAQLPADLAQWEEFNNAIDSFRQGMGGVETAERPPNSVPRVLIADMAIAKVNLFKRNPGVKIFIPAEGSGGGELATNCATNLRRIEEFFSALLQDQAPPFELDQKAVEQLEQTLWATHGYHVLGLVQKNLRKSEIIFLPMNPPPSVNTGISDHKSYIQKNILPDMVRLFRAVKEYSPDLVLVASSDTVEENERDLKVGGYTPSDARRGAEEILGAWTGAWTTLISSFPKIWFVVPSGNGGIDGLGDRLESRMIRSGPIPAVLPFGNMIRVASFEERKDSCLSRFSNFGVEASDVAARGREVESWAPCAKRPSVRLSGTSQAAAKVTAALAEALENGITVEETMKTFLRESCLEDRVSTASRIPER